MQANTHAGFMDPGNEHWPLMSVLNAAHAGELFIKAIIATEHPLLIFKDVPGLDDNGSADLDFPTLLKRGRTYDFDKLPQMLWATTGIRIPHPDCYERLRKYRNAVQHFCPPDDDDPSDLALEFIYNIIDPLIRDRFGLFAIEHHEDHLVGYDYLVGTLLRSGIRFSLPDDFDLGEIDARREIAGADDGYKAWFRGELSRIGKAGFLLP
ncbi:hypothetical protein [Novosphingobium mangrovi (ex Huang et al. 2023)]|uniref:Uncharacterized protein n=1 Tax=Novosphingobium mangrovi (ex Huang et al. 2023) TaxID=2976432 RepID=A0ABT2IAK5_9SPHN|nr:hypothetical protein [Novosphingobium mangrovi (ex Huang et al. 2023)]MCT2401841.1 hypothetical protein [Novosphingobium mangrovi (ex Huang et al. 2023)]